MARRANETKVAVEDDQPLLPIYAPKHQASRAGKKAITGHFDPPVARAVAILAAKQDRTLISLMQEAVDDLLRKYKEPV